MPDFNQHWPDLRVGDVYCVSGNKPASVSEWKRTQRAPWFRSLASQQSQVPSYPEIVLSQAYLEYCSAHGKEPDWAKNVSRKMLRFLRAKWLLSDNFEPLALILERKELDFGFAVQDYGFVRNICDALRVYRLGNIRQLGLLYDPMMNELAGGDGLGLMFNHTRYAHSLTVMAVASLLGLRCRLNSYEMAHLQAAAATHDVLTPAGGDSVKFIDPEAFDEDAHYAEIFLDNPEWTVVRERYGLDEALLATIVRGQGKLGHLLDIADKLSYVAHDLDAYLMGNTPATFRHIEPPASLMAIWQCQKALGHPICDLWRYVSMARGQVVITNGKRLAGFLKMRGLLFKQLYHNPRARSREQLFGILIVDPLYRSGRLTREHLISMGDDTLIGLMSRAAGCKDLAWVLATSRIVPEVEAFPTLNAAKERARALTKENPSLLVLWEEFRPVSDKAVRYLVRDCTGKIRPFAEAYPEETEEILALGKDANPAKLYVLALEKTDGIFSAEFQKQLLSEQRERLQRE